MHCSTSLRDNVSRLHAHFRRLLISEEVERKFYHGLYGDMPSNMPVKYNNRLTHCAPALHYHARYAYVSDPLHWSGKSLQLR
jgi:hypothetical protein